MTKRDMVLMWIVVMIETIVTLPLDLVWQLALTIKSIMIRFVYFVLRKIPSFKRDDGYMTMMKNSTWASMILMFSKILAKIAGLNGES